jgi:SHS2 domain-containing protein
MDQARHEFEDHTSEVKIRLYAPSLRDLFSEAALALADIMAESPEAASEATERVQLDAQDIEALLVEWLNELVFRNEGSGLVYTAVQIDRLSETHLEARIGGTAGATPKTPVKAATYHDLRIEPTDDEGWTASVVVDV